MDPTCDLETRWWEDSVVIWSMCSLPDMGSPINQETTTTGDGYVSILSNRLHAFMSIMHSDELFHFHQDIATPQMSRRATEWLQEHTSDCTHFHLSPKSPDMNIVEHIWDALQRAVQKRSPPQGTSVSFWLPCRTYCVNFLQITFKQ